MDAPLKERIVPFLQRVRGHGPVRSQEPRCAIRLLVLAKKAGSLPPQTILAGWLYKTARLTAANYLRMEIRRQRREQEAYMQSLLRESELNVWTRIAPLLDAAMEHLGHKEPDAVLLRFFEGKSFGEMGSILRAREGSVQKRVERALEKMRNFFARRGIALSEGILLGVLSIHPVQAAPVGLAKSVSMATMTKATVISGSSLLLMKSTLKMMTWLKMKTVTVVGVWVILIAGTTTIAVVQVQKFIERGRASIVTGHYGEAIADFNQALQLDPKVTAAYFNRGRARKLQGSYAQALADYDQNLKLHQGSRCTAISRATETLVRQQLTGTALDKQIDLLCQSVLHALIDRRLMLDYFKKNGGSIPSSYLDGRVADEIKERFGNNRQVSSGLWRQEGTPRQLSAETCR